MGTINRILGKRTLNKDPLAGAVIFDFAKPVGTQIIYNRDLNGAPISLQNGSTAGADTNDGTFTGTGLSFGVDDFAKVGSSWFDDMAAFTCITAFNAASAGGGTGGRVWDKNQRLFRTISDNTLRYIPYRSGAADQWSVPYTFNAPTIASVTYNPVTPDTAPTIFLNNLKQVVTRQVAYTGAVTSDAGFDLYIGNSALATANLDGTIYYQAWFNRILSDSQYLAAYRKIKSILNARGIAI